jgi:hypothetical protein
MDWPDPFPGASLETVGNGSPRKMIVQRQNPAYRSAHIYEKSMKKDLVRRRKSFPLQIAWSNGFQTDAAG